MIEKYKVIPKVVKVVQWNKDNFDEVIELCGTNAWTDNYGLSVRAANGTRLVFQGDFIIKDDEKFYVLDKEKFRNNYYKCE